MSENALGSALIDMGFGKRHVPHGFRSLLRTVLHEHGFDSEVVASVTEAVPRRRVLRRTGKQCTLNLHHSSKEQPFMPRYLIQASYTSAAIAAFVNKPQDRLAGIRAAVEKLGGKLESFDFALGDDDVIGIAAFPDDVAAAALSLAVNAPGHVKSYKTTRLLSPEEFLTAQQKAHGVSYQAPAKA